MGAVERRSKQRAELRGQILEAARRIVLCEGYRALTMRRIAEAVEYSPAAIYQYFENRDAIAKALMDQGFEELAKVLEAAAAAEEPGERLSAVARAYVGFGLEHPETYRLMFMEDPEITASFLENASQYSDAGERAYAALLASGVDKTTADALWTSLHGIVALKLTCPRFPETPTGQLVDTVLRAYSGLSPSPT